MRVLVTGKNGQIGSSLVSQLCRLPEVKLLGLGRKELDIIDLDKVDQIVNSFKPDVIINAAAYTAVDKAESEIKLANAINYQGPKNLAAAAAKADAAIIHISTDYVFAGDKQGLYTENDSVNPQSVYGQSKLDGERAVGTECEKHIILRTSWVFSEYGNNFVKTMLRLAQNCEKIGVVGDQFGGPTYAGDIAKALIIIAQSIHKGNAAFGVYHYSGSPYVSWQEFSLAIFNVAQAKGIIQKPVVVKAISTAEYRAAAKRPANSMLDCNKIENEFSIKISNWKAALANISLYQ